jgi:hypothetical protein
VPVFKEYLFCQYGFGQYGTESALIINNRASFYFTQMQLLEESDRMDHLGSMTNRA